MLSNPCITASTRILFVAEISEDNLKKEEELRETLLELEDVAKVMNFIVYMTNPII